MNDATFNNKRLVLKVYNSAFEFLGVMQQVEDYPTIQEMMNEAGSSLDINIARTDYDDPLFEVGNIIKGIVYYGEPDAWTTDTDDDITTNLGGAITFGLGGVNGEQVLLARLTNTRLTKNLDYITITLATPGADLLQYMATGQPNMGYTGYFGWGGGYISDFLARKIGHIFRPLTDMTLYNLKTGVVNVGYSLVTPLYTDPYWNGEELILEVHNSTAFNAGSKIAESRITLSTQVSGLDYPTYGQTWGYLEPWRDGFNFNGLRLVAGQTYYFLYRTVKIGTAMNQKMLYMWIPSVSNYPDVFTYDKTYEDWYYTTDFGWQQISTGGPGEEVYFSMARMTATYDQTKITMSGTVSNILKRLVNIVQSSGGLVSLTPTSVQNNDQVIVVELNTETVFGSINAVMRTVDKDWYWYVDNGTGVFYFRLSPANPEVYLTDGRDIADMTVNRSLEKIVNVIYFSGGQMPDGYSLFRSGMNPESVAQWGQRVLILSDGNVTDVATADYIIQAELSAYSEPVYWTQVFLTDAQINTLQISLGKRIGFRNFINEQGSVNDLALQVVSVLRQESGANFEMASTSPRVSNQMADILRQTKQLQAYNNPPTTTE